MANISQALANVAAQDDAAAIPIVQPSGEPYLDAAGEPCTVSVLGSESKAYRRAQERYERKLSQLYQRTPNPSSEQVDALKLERTLAAVTGWSGWTYDRDGAEIELPFNPDNAKQLIGGVPHIRAQVEGGIAAHANFSGRPSAG